MKLHEVNNSIKKKILNPSPKVTSGGIFPRVKPVVVERPKLNIHVGPKTSLALCVLLVSGVVYTLAFGDYFSAKQVNITGLQNNTEAQAFVNNFLQTQKRAWIFDQGNLFFSDTDRIESMLEEKLISVKKVDSVVKDFPNTLNISIVERQETFGINFNDSRFILGQDGRVMRSLSLDVPFPDQVTVLEWPLSVSITQERNVQEDLALKIYEYKRAVLDAGFKSVRMTYLLPQAFPRPPSPIKVAEESTDTPTTIESESPKSTEQSEMAPTEKELSFDIENKLSGDFILQGILPDKYGNKEVFIFASANNGKSPEILKHQLSLLFAQDDKRLANVFYLDMRYSDRAYLCSFGSVCEKETPWQISQVMGVSSKVEEKKEEPAQDPPSSSVESTE